MSTEDNKASVRKAYQAANQQSVESFIDFVAPNQVDHSAPPGLPGGIEGARQVVGMFLTAFPDLHITVEDIIAEGDKVVARITYSGTQQGTFMGIPPTGKHVTWKSIDINRHQPPRGWQERRALDGDGCARSDATARRCPCARTDQLASGELAYEGGIKSGEAMLAGQHVSFEQRVTNIYRREAGGWKIFHPPSDSSPAMQSGRTPATSTRRGQFDLYRKAVVAPCHTS